VAAAIKVGAEERSPSAPRLGPSIVKELGGKAPRGKAGEPHSPVPLPSGGDFAAFNEPCQPRSPRLEARQDFFAPHSLPDGRSEERGNEARKALRLMHIARSRTRSLGNTLGSPGNEPFPASRISFSPGKAVQCPGNASLEGLPVSSNLHQGGLRPPDVLSRKGLTGRSPAVIICTS
jgi:hypothetical protein